MQLTMCIKAGDSSFREGYMIAFDYDVDVVETLKNRIPHTEREYYAASKQWWISISFEHIINELFPNFDALAHKQGLLF